MDLCAVTVVECCANLPSTNGMAEHCQVDMSQKLLSGKIITLVAGACCFLKQLDPIV